MKIEVVFLFAVIGQRLAGNLPPGDAPAVGEDREKKRVHARPLLKNVEYFLGAFVNERNCADLNADHFRTHRGARGLGGGERNTCPHGGLEKVSAIHIRIRHVLFLPPFIATGVDFRPLLPCSAVQVLGAGRSHSGGCSRVNSRRT